MKWHQLSQAWTWTAESAPRAARHPLGVRQRDRDAVHDADTLGAGDAIVGERLAPILCCAGMNFIKFVRNRAKY
jgi:hypothetical protein